MVQELGSGVNGGMDWEPGVSRTQTGIHGINNESCRIAQRTLYVINQKGKDMRKNKHICITESLCHAAEIITRSQINYTSIKFLKVL